MYQILSITTVPEPLSAGFIIMSCRCFSWLMACLSVAVRLSRILLGVQVEVVMSSLTASKNVLSARSLSLGGGGVPSTFATERSVIFVCVGSVVIVKKILSQSHASGKIVDVS